MNEPWRTIEEAAHAACYEDPVDTDPVHERGWYGMACWNGLSHDQQRKLIERGALNAFDPQDREPQGACLNGAEVSVELASDEAPGPRFYCLACAIAYLADRRGE